MIVSSGSPLCTEYHNIGCFHFCCNHKTWFKWLRMIKTVYFLNSVITYLTCFSSHCEVLLLLLPFSCLSESFPQPFFIRVGLLATNYLSFCSPGNVFISPSFLNSHFIRSRTHVWQLFIYLFFITWKNIVSLSSGFHGFWQERAHLSWWSLLSTSQ